MHSPIKDKFFDRGFLLSFDALAVCGKDVERGSGSGSLRLFLMLLSLLSMGQYARQGDCRPGRGVHPCSTES